MESENYKVLWHGDHMDGKLTITIDKEEDKKELTAPKRVHYFLVTKDCQFSGECLVESTHDAVLKLLQDISLAYLRSIKDARDEEIKSGRARIH